MSESFSYVGLELFENVSHPPRRVAFADQLMRIGNLRYLSAISSRSNTNTRWNPPLFTVQVLYFPEVLSSVYLASFYHGKQTENAEKKNILVAFNGK